jgi:hypothetical protein
MLPEIDIQYCLQSTCKRFRCPRQATEWPCCSFRGTGNTGTTAGERASDYDYCPTNYLWEVSDGFERV